MGQENPLKEGMATQYSCLENSKDRKAWQATVCRFTKNRTLLKNTWMVLFLWWGNLFLNYLIYFNWRPITLQYCGGFCHSLTWISHRCTYVPPFRSPQCLPPHPISLGCPRAPTLSVLLHASNLHWSSVLHVVIYMFQCYSLNSPPIAFTHIVQKYVLYICVSYAILHIGSSLPSF